LLLLQTVYEKKNSDYMRLRAPTHYTP